MAADVARRRPLRPLGLRPHAPDVAVPRAALRWLAHAQLPAAELLDDGPEPGRLIRVGLHEEVGKVGRVRRPGLRGDHRLPVDRPALAPALPMLALQPLAVLGMLALPPLDILLREDAVHLEDAVALEQPQLLCAERARHLVLVRPP